MQSIISLLLGVSMSALLSLATSEHIKIMRIVHNAEYVPERINYRGGDEPLARKAC